MWSTQNLPALKQFCVSQRRPFTVKCFFTRQSKTNEYTLAIQQIIDIGQLYRDTLWSLPGFGIGFMSDFDQSRG